MASATLPPLTAYTNSDWFEEPFAFFDGDENTPQDLTGASARMALRLAGRATPALELSTANGYLVLALPNEIGVCVPQASMASLEPGAYAFDLVLTYASGQTETVLVGQVDVVGGIS